VQSLSLKSGSLIYLRFQKFLAASTGATQRMPMAGSMAYEIVE
jgi:hypothetical protein